MIPEAGTTMPVYPQPSAANAYLADHLTLLCRSLRALTGRHLAAPDLSPEAAARWLYQAPFALLSHDTAQDPILTYANRCALDLFELTWKQLVVMPSRLTAEAPDREERARLLARVTAHGYIDDYTGVRVSRTGRRFEIEGATVWNLIDGEGRHQGQAATFAVWRCI
jgi:hypothetical protein